MKLTVWQQFSSNHSTTFSMVGEFKTAQEAEQALEKLRSFLEDVDRWIKKTCYVFSSDEFEGKTLTDEELLFFYTQDISAEYSVVEWVYGVGDFLNEVLVQQDNFVLIYSLSEWTHGGKPFDELLRKWGAKVYLESKFLGEAALVLNFESHFSSEAEAEAEKVEKKILREGKKTYPIWSRFYGGKLVDTEAFEHDIQCFEQDKQIRKELSKLYFAIGESQNEKTKARLKRERLRLSEDFYQFVREKGKNVRRTRVYRSIGRTPKAIKREKNVLIAEDWKLVGDELTMGFPAFVAWLEYEGATISYQFEERA